MCCVVEFEAVQIFLSCSLPQTKLGVFVTVNLSRLLAVRQVAFHAGAQTTVAVKNGISQTLSQPR